MRIHRLVWVLALMPLPCAMAQRNEIDLMAGATTPSTKVSVGSQVSVSGGTQVTAQVSYAYRLMETKSGYFSVELPVAWVQKVSVGVSSNLISAGKSQVFVTPGVRYQFASRSVVSPYVVGGFGAGWFDGAAVRMDRWLQVNAGTEVKPAFDFGGGLELHAGRVLGFRVEVRDYVAAGPNLCCRNHVTYTGGLAFHF